MYVEFEENEKRRISSLSKTRLNSRNENLGTTHSKTFEDL